jgi:hypothetical protein
MLAKLIIASHEDHAAPTEMSDKLARWPAVGGQYRRSPGSRAPHIEPFTGL